MGGTTRVIQVTNVAPGATLDQMKTLFGFLGDIEDIKLFPGEDSIVPVTSRVCFVKYEDPTSVGVAQHLTNTVFIDRALIVVPCGDGIIPDEHKALAIAAPANAVAGLMPTPSGGGLLPTPATGILGQVGGLLPTPAPGILGQVPSLVGLAGAAQITAPFDSTLAALGLPQPPPLPGNVDPSKIEEIRRTIYVGNLDSQTVTAEQLLNFFSQVGEVKYVRMAGDETQPTRFAFVEFSDQKSVAAALTYNGVMFGGRPLKINHSNNAIVKPQTKTPEAAAREMEEAMKRVRDAQALIQAAIDPELGPKAGSSTDEFKDNDTDVKKKKSRSRSRSRDRHKRSRSRSRSKRRSRSRSRRRSRSRGRYSRSPKRRSHSPRRRRSRSRSRGRDRRRSRSRSRDHKRSRTPPRGYRGRYTRSRSRERRRRSRSPRSRRSRSRTRRSPKRRSRSSSDSPKRSKRKKKDKDRERDRERDRSRERERSKKHKRDKDRDREHRESKSKEVKVTRDYDEEEKGYDSDKERDSSSSSKEQQNDDRDIKDERDYSPKENTEQMDMDLSD